MFIGAKSMCTGSNPVPPTGHQISFNIIYFIKLKIILFISCLVLWGSHNSTIVIIMSTIILLSLFILFLNSSLIVVRQNNTLPRTIPKPKFLLYPLNHRHLKQQSIIHLKINTYYRNFCTTNKFIFIIQSILIYFETIIIPYLKIVHNWYWFFLLILKLQIYCNLSFCLYFFRIVWLCRSYVLSY